MANSEHGLLGCGGLCFCVAATAWPAVAYTPALVGVVGSMVCCQESKSDRDGVWVYLHLHQVEWERGWRTTRPYAAIAAIGVVDTTAACFLAPAEESRVDMTSTACRCVQIHSHGYTPYFSRYCICRKHVVPAASRPWRHADILAVIANHRPSRGRW